MTEPDSEAEHLHGRDWGLTCAEVLELMTEYLEGALGRGDTARFEAHIANCDGCTIVLEQLDDVVGLTGQLTEDDVEPETVDELLRAFDDWKKPGSAGNA